MTPTTLPSRRGRYGTVGRPVRLFEGFLQKREQVRERLDEVGITEADLHEWLTPDGRNGRFNDNALEESLREAGVSDTAVEGQDRTELEELLTEAASTSNFGAYLSDKATKRLMWAYREAPSVWRRYGRTYSVPDFKPVSFVKLDEMADLLPVTEGGAVVDQDLGEIEGPEVTVGTWARAFGISRKAIINDDLNQLRERPAAMGRAVARTMAKDVVQRTLEANPNAYDGTPTFAVGHGNLISGVIHETTVGQLVTGLEIQRDDHGNRLGLRAGGLLVPPELRLRAMVIVNSTIVPLAGQVTTGLTNALPHGQGGANVIASVVPEVTVEPYLNDATDYYVYANPNDAPGLAVGFLNGKQDPDVFLKDPGMRNVLGTSDPYDGDVFDVNWMTRHDWGTAFLDWRGWQKAAN